MCLNSAKLEELVFAVPTGILWKILPYNANGFIKGDSGALNRIVENGVFRRRSELEDDPAFKQIIPYGIISHLDSFYLFTRKTGQVEKRLHHKLHLGVGGHMNPVKTEMQGEQYPLHELKRELFEEVNLLNDCKIEEIKFHGFINDDSIPVSRVHLGLLYNIRLSAHHISVKETDKMSARWINKAAVAGIYDEMETWTRIAVDYFIK